MAGKYNSVKYGGTPPSTNKVSFEGYEDYEEEYDEGEYEEQGYLDTGALGRRKQNSGPDISASTIDNEREGEWGNETDNDISRNLGNTREINSKSPNVATQGYPTKNEINKEIERLNGAKKEWGDVDNYVLTPQQRNDYLKISKEIGKTQNTLGEINNAREGNESREKYEKYVTQRDKTIDLINETVRKDPGWQDVAYDNDRYNSIAFMFQEGTADPL